MAVVAARTNLFQCPTAAHPHAESRAPHAAVIGVGRADAKCASRWATFAPCQHGRIDAVPRSEEHTSELQSLMRISYAVFCLKKKNKTETNYHHCTHINNQ